MGTGVKDPAITTRSAKCSMFSRSWKSCFVLRFVCAHGRTGPFRACPARAPRISSDAQSRLRSLWASVLFPCSARVWNEQGREVCCCIGASSVSSHNACRGTTLSSLPASRSGPSGAQRPKAATASGHKVDREAEGFAININNENDQADRAISTGKLHTLLRFHTRPINVVVYNGSDREHSFSGWFPA